MKTRQRSCFAALSTLGRCVAEKGQTPLPRDGDDHRNKLKAWGKCRCVVKAN